MTELNTFTLPALLAEQIAIADAGVELKDRATAVKDELARRYADSARMSLEQSGKTHGTISLPLQDGFVAKADVKQTVSWDSDALMAIAKDLPFPRVEQLFNIKFSMSETIYKGIAAAAPELREKVDAARTTKLSEPVITLIKEG